MDGMISTDYQERKYLSAIEASKYMGITVDRLHDLVSKGDIHSEISGSGQQRFELDTLKVYSSKNDQERVILTNMDPCSIIDLNGTKQTVYNKNSMNMNDIPDNSVHLMITSPPYFDAKMYSNIPIENDIGNIHGLDEWFEKISKVWTESYRVLEPGRKSFINIMNLPIRVNGGSFRTLNLTGKTIDLCEKIGFIFKRDIIWEKTNGVRAQFGTYPYPGGILLNNMHEFILEFEKPCTTSSQKVNKYSHLSREIKEASKIDKDFWLSLKNSDVWRMTPQGSGDNRSHVAPFPMELPYRLIKAYSYIGETVLDPFAGSGTTLITAADLKRNGIGYEINPEIANDCVKSMRMKGDKNGIN